MSVADRGAALPGDAPEIAGQLAPAAWVSLAAWRNSVSASLVAIPLGRGTVAAANRSQCSASARCRERCSLFSLTAALSR
jgi:hypothetical protein